MAYDKNLSDVEITAEATNPVKKKAADPSTRLKAIGGVPAEIIRIDDLRMFCVRNNIRGARKASKVQLCRAIAGAKVRSDEGEPSPYEGLFDTEDEHTPIDVDMIDDGIGRSDRKRSRDDLEDVVGRDTTPMRLAISDKAQQGKLITLQSRITQSIEIKNMAIYLKETIDSASAVRREMREERACRAALWAKLVEQVGDESVASSKYFIFRKARQENETVLGSDDDFVKGAVDQLLEDIFEEDSLIQELKKQHVKLTETISKLV